MRLHPFSISCAALLCGAACASVRPSFEWEPVSGAEARGGWARLMAVRYGCDTLMERSLMSLQVPDQGLPAGGNLTMRPGQDPCPFIRPVPIRVRAWETPTSVREEWEYRGVDPADIGTVRAQTVRHCTLVFEGSNTRSLRAGSYTCL